MQFDLNNDRQDKKETEVRVGKVIDEKLYAIRLELAKEKKQRNRATVYNRKSKKKEKRKWQMLIHRMNSPTGVQKMKASFHHSVAILLRMFQP